MNPDGWTPCEKAMPPADDPNVPIDYVNVFAPARGVDMAAWDGNVWQWRSSGYAIESEVTHWRPLPNPPLGSSFLEEVRHVQESFEVVSKLDDLERSFLMHALRVALSTPGLAMKSDLPQALLELPALLRGLPALTLEALQALDEPQPDETLRALAEQALDVGNQRHLSNFLAGVMPEPFMNDETLKELFEPVGEGLWKMKAIDSRVLLEQQVKQLTQQLYKVEAELRQLTEDAQFVAKNSNFPRQSPLWYSQQAILDRPDPLAELLRRHQTLSKKL